MPTILATALASPLGTFNQIVWLLKTKEELAVLFSRLWKQEKGVDLHLYSSRKRDGGRKHI